MKKYAKIIIPLVIVFGIIGGVAFFLHRLSQDGTLDMADVYATIKSISVYFIPVVILLAAIIIALIIFRKKDKKFKFLLKSESVIALLIAITVTVNVVVFGPMSSLFNLNYATMGEVSAATLKKSNALINDIAEEGTVLLKNEGNYLPLETKSKKLNVFGWASTNPVYGGTGSGNVDTSSAVTLIDGLENGGFELNSKLSDFYKDYRSDRPEVGMREQDWTLPEPPIDSYPDDLLSDANKFSDTAVVVIGRVGGEGADLPTNMTSKDITYKGNKDDFNEGEHFLQLSKSEKNLVDLVTTNFENVVVIVNAANAMELGWLEEYENIKGAIWTSGPGETGFNAIGNILNGSVNPSGRTVDTFVYDLKDTPTWNNFGDFHYKDSDYTHVNYNESIYVGYKFYESFFDNNETGYKEAVQYPLGFGLSYTDFTQKMGDITVTDDDLITFDVTVTNTGNVKGKEVVQAYFTPPYTNGGIEKANTNLVTFAKTDILEPKESQTITMSFKKEDMASYSDMENGAYVLEKGTYDIQIKSNSHNVLDEKKYEEKETIVYNEGNKRSSDKVTAVNQFDYVVGEVNYLSRKDNFSNYDEATSVPKERKLTDKESDGLMNSSNYILDELDVEMPKTGEKNGKVLADYVTLDYDDESWNELLDQLTIKDMSKIISYGGYQTVAAPSVGKVQTYDFDGPAGISSFFVSVKASAFPTATMIAATWNKELANKRGKAIGSEANQMGVSGWYGPAMNIHRNAFSGRNFEYYSEDSLLSGIMAANEISGAKSQGVYSYMKHFALNDQETNRSNLLLTWSNEQALREIYLKPFELAVKEGGANAAMSSFNYIGNKWTGVSSELLQTVLRGEWGFNGFVCTDYFSGSGYMDADVAIRNGNDIMLSTTGENGASLTDTTSATAVTAMRNATHNVLYTVANSRAYAKGETISMLMPWQRKVIVIDSIISVVIILIQALLILWYFKRFNKKPLASADK